MNSNQHNIDRRQIFKFPVVAGMPSTGVMIAVSVSVTLLLLLLIILLCIFKQRKAKRRRAAEMTRDDDNPVYGDYYDPDPTMEVEDTNDYYSSGLVNQLICKFLLLFIAFLLIFLAFLLLFIAF